VVVLAGLINSLKVVRKNIKDVKIVISGVGAAGVATAKLLIRYGAKNVIMVDTCGIIYQGRDNMNPIKVELSKITNQKNQKGGVRDALRGADIFIGLSAPNILTEEDIKCMGKDAIVFAMSNPIPEIMPERAKSGGAKIIATGRSDYPNQINNVLVFPGIFRGALDYKIRTITDDHKMAAAKAIAGLIKKPKSGKIIPEALDKRVMKAVASVFKK
ncbi:MAG TPA: NAD-dependent malic enzyme, partial [Patescibacteria group bacterium]|nr:NAD-dependent malic enzyme [Patescibacteria group bacterium]